MIRLQAVTLLFVLASAVANAQKFEHIPVPKSLYQAADTTSIVFLGDVMMHSEQIKEARKADGTYRFCTYFSRIRKYLSDADLAVANMEFTLAGKPYSGYPSFSAPESYADYAANCGVNIFLTANNHILDKGRNGIRRTLEIYSRMEEERRVRYTGTALSAEDDNLRNPLVVAVKGIRIALLNFTYGTNNTSIASGYPKVRTIDRPELASAIKKAKEARVDYIIALPHWGIEYVLEHSGEQEKLARFLAEEGCDAIIGTHPHVVQDAGAIVVANDDGIGTRNVPVVYSLGNAVSNMRAPDTRIGLLVTLRIATDKFGDRKLLEPQMTLTWCSRPGTLTESYAVLPVKEYLGKKERWRMTSDYDNMVSTYKRVKKTTGIKD